MRGTPTQPEVKAVKFRNFTDRDFSWSYDGVGYNFKAGSEVYMEDYKAEHFAKHLIDRELTLMSPKDKDYTGDQVKRKELEAKCFTVDEVVSNENAFDIEARKTKTEEKITNKKEDEFPDLNKEEKVEPKKKGKK